MYTISDPGICIGEELRRDTFVIKVGSTELAFESDGKITWNGREITEDLDLVNAMRELAGIQAITRVMEE